MFRSGFKIRSGPVALAVAGLALFMSMGGTGYAIGAASHTPAAPSAPVWHAIDLTGNWQDGGFNTATPAWWLDSNHVLHFTRGDLHQWQPSACPSLHAAGRRPAGEDYISSRFLRQRHRRRDDGQPERQGVPA